MPDMDGPRTLGALREIDPHVCCAFMSGDTGDYTVEQLLALGAFDVLQKPFASLSTLVRILWEVGGQRQGSA
jgi:CheY-like chemotaxis protein